MPFTDLPLSELREYRSSAGVPADLHQFWASTLAEARNQAWTPKIEPVTSGLRLLDVHDVTFSGFAGHPVRAWLRRPRGEERDLPVVVRFHGYGGGRELAHQAGAFALAGYATLDVDTRGQGSVAGWVGETADPVGSGASWPGFMTRGITRPEDYFYRRVFTDAVLALDAVRVLPGVDPAQVVVAGASQGAGIALAVAALADDVRAVMADVPFLSDFPRALAAASSGPYTEIVGYLATHRSAAAVVLETLSYFDVAGLVPAARAEAVFSCAHMDAICPPSTVYAAFNAYGGPKQMHDYPYNGHEGGQFEQEALELAWLPAVVPLP